MKNLGKMEAEARKAAGQALNELKEEIATAINQKQEAFEDAVLNARLATEWVDTSQPVKPTRKDIFTRSPKQLTKLFPSLVKWVSHGRKGQRSKTTGTTSG